MKYYKLNNTALEKELDTDFASGLTLEQISKRQNECSNCRKGGIFDISNVDFDFKKAVPFAVLSCVLYLLFGVFTKNTNHYFSAIYVFCLFLTLFLSLYFLIKFVNVKISKASAKTFVTVKVLRNGETFRIPVTEVLYGDIVFLEKGDFIPFDGRIIECESLLVDESEVCSKSVSEKYVGIINDDNVSVSNVYNTVFCGSFVISGSAKTVVTDVGNRVYVSKIQKKKNKYNKSNDKLLDYFRFFNLSVLLIFFVFCSVNSLISSDYFSIVSLAFVLASLYFLDLPKFILEVCYAFERINLFEKNIHLNTKHVFDKITQSKLLVLEQEQIFDKDADVLAVCTNSVHNISELSNSDYKTLLFYSLASFDDNSTFNLAANKKVNKLLNAFGIDVNDVSGLCPAISHYEKFNYSLEVCGRVYNSDNLIIAKGHFLKILEMCSRNIDESLQDKLTSLSKLSNEILAVAVKKVNVIPNDLSEETSGFELIGFVGLEKTFSKSAFERIEDIGSFGIKTVVLYNGDRTSATHLSDAPNVKAVDYKDISSLSKQQFLDVDIFYNYNENPDLIIKKSKELGVNIIHTYDHHESKSVAVSSLSEKPVIQQKSDIVCQPSVDAFQSLVNSSFRVIDGFKLIFYETAFLFAFLSLSGVFNSILFGTNLLLPSVLLLIVLIFVFSEMALFICFQSKPKLSKINLALKYSSYFLLFLIYAVVIKFICPQSSGEILTVLLLMLIAEFDFIRHSVKEFIVIVPAIVVSIIIIYIAKVPFVFGLLSIFFGLLFNLLSQFLSKYTKIFEVKNDRRK